MINAVRCALLFEGIKWSHGGGHCSHAQSFLHEPCLAPCVRRLFSLRYQNLSPNSKVIRYRAHVPPTEPVIHREVLANDLEKRVMFPEPTLVYARLQARERQCSDWRWFFPVHSYPQDRAHSTTLARVSVERTNICRPRFSKCNPCWLGITTMRPIPRLSAIGIKQSVGDPIPRFSVFVFIWTATPI